MNIIFDAEHVESIKNSNILLELDTFKYSNIEKTTTAYCVIENINILDMGKIAQDQKLHADLITAYKKKDFKLCKELIDVLIGCFDGEVDSFYNELTNRINKIESSEHSNSWNPIIVQPD